MQGKPVGTIFAELDLDKTKFTRAQNTILKEAGVVTMGVEKNYKTLGIKSATIFDAMRKQAENAYQGIKHSARATADDILRAEKAKNEKLKAINEEQFGHQGSLLSTLKKNWVAAGATIAAVAVAAKKTFDVIASATMAAARYETIGVAMNVVGKNAGYGADQMARFQSGLEKTGISMSGARQALTRMAQAQLDLSKSSELARIAQDAAVIGNINSSEAFDRMIRGIQTAQVEVLRNIGINVSFENSYQKVAKQLGRTAASLSESEKATIRMNAVLEKGKDISGTYTAAMETTGKKILSLERHFDNLKVAAGEAFTPALGQAVDLLTEALKRLNDALTTTDLEAYTEKLKQANDKIELMERGKAHGAVFRWLFGNDKAVLDSGIQAATRDAENLFKLFDRTDFEEGGGAWGPPPGSAAAPGGGGGEYSAADLKKMEAIQDVWDFQKAIVEEKYEVLSRQYAYEEAAAVEAKEMEELRQQDRMELILNLNETELLAKQEMHQKMHDMNVMSANDEIIIAKKTKDQLLGLDLEKVKSSKTAAGNMAQAGQVLLNSTMKGNEAVFQATKAFSIANAMMTAYLGANQALGSMPYPYNIVAAGSVLALGLANVASIASQSPGDSSGGGMSAGGAVGTYSASPTTGLPETQETEQLPAINVNIENYVDSEENRRNLAEWLNEFVEDKGGYLVSSNAKFADGLT